jgi:hypothetical protein
MTGAKTIRGAAVDGGAERRGLSLTAGIPLRHGLALPD